MLTTNAKPATQYSSLDESIDRTLHLLKRAIQAIPDVETESALIQSAYDICRAQNYWAAMMRREADFQTFQKIEFLVEVLEFAINQVEHALHVRKTDPSSSVSTDYYDYM